MSQRLRITHYYHSGFSVACEDILFVFDYWRGENDDLPPESQISARFLQSFRQIYVFISHEHPDHLDPIVYTWKSIAKVTYIVSADMPIGTRGRRMSAGQRMMLENGISVSAFDSTDLGVSFLLDLRGIRIFHAGDLNFWHWREESTKQEIDEADQEFREAVRPLEKESIDVAFFPVDPRQGSMFAAGADYFILSVKPRLLIPMHYFHRMDVIMEYARTASCRSTEVLAMPGLGDMIDLSFDGAGYMDISFPRAEEPEETPADGEDQDLEELIGEDNPFDESDLPLFQLAEDEDDEEDGETGEEGEDARDPEDGPDGAESPDSRDGEEKDGEGGINGKDGENGESGESAPDAPAGAGPEKDPQPVENSDGKNGLPGDENKQTDGNIPPAAPVFPGRNPGPEAGKTP